VEPPIHFTDRERLTVRSLLDGRQTDDIARELHLTREQLRATIHHVEEKLAMFRKMLSIIE
jgi:DNA-binding CsgD family transcriptional regulator